MTNQIEERMEVERENMEAATRDNFVSKDRAMTQFALERELKEIQLYAGPGQLATIITSIIKDTPYLVSLIIQMQANLTGRE